MPMRLAPNVFDVWVFRRGGEGARFLLMYTSEEKARRYFNGGRFWQIPSGFIEDEESPPDAILRDLAGHGLRPTSIWAGEHAYIIYNRRYAEMQLIGVYAAEVADDRVVLDPLEHSEHGWFGLEDCLARVHYRGLKDGLRSVHEFVAGCPAPAKELCLYDEGRSV